MLDFCLVKCFSSPLPSPLEVWGRTCGAEVLLQICLHYISCPWELCTQQPVNLQVFFILPKPKEQYQPLKYKPRLSCSHPLGLVTYSPAVGLYGMLCSGLLGRAVTERFAHLTIPEEALQCPQGFQLPLLRLKIVSLLCPCGASCAWTTVLLNCAPPAPHNL